MPTLVKNVKRTIIILISTSLLSCWGFQEYWGQKVRKWCIKDGGIKIYEEVNLSKEEYLKNDGANGYIRINPLRYSKEEHDYYYVSELEKIHHFNNANGDLYVQKSIYTTYRKSDNKIMETQTHYLRKDGDLLKGLGFEQSSYSCSDIPEIKERYGKKFYKYEI